METPFLRVSRPVSACSRCRNAKTRCDGRLPACGACERTNRASECSSANDEFARGKERSYVAYLESRIERLEKDIAQVQRRKGSVDMLGSALGQPSASSAHVTGRRSQWTEASDVDELVADFGYLSVNATARDFHGFTKHMSFAKLVLSTSTVEPMPQNQPSTLPPRDTAVTLVQYSLKEIFSLYPVLSETAVFGSLEAVYQRREYADPWDRWVIRMIFANSLISQSRSKGDPQYCEAVRHASSAMEVIEAVLHPGSVAGIRAVLLLVLYSMKDPSHFRSWYLIGVASRVTIDLGLHQEPSDDLRMKESQLQLRRRIFYCVYALDRTISISLHRGFSFTDDEGNVELPTLPTSPSSYFAMSTTPDQSSTQVSVDTARELLKLRRMQSIWYHALSQSNREALREPWQYRCNALVEMQNWASALPESVPKPMKLMFRSEMLYSSILLIWPPTATVSVCPYGQALIFDYAVKHAITQTISENLRSITSQCDLLRAMFVGQRLLDVIEDTPNFLSHLTAPQVPLMPPNSATPPLVERRPQSDMLTQAINAIKRTGEILHALGLKFGYPDGYQRYHNRSAVTLQKLYTMAQSQATNVSAPQAVPNIPQAPVWSPGDGMLGYYY